LQLFEGENWLGAFSLPQILRPAFFGFARKNAFGSAKYRSIAALHAMTSDSIPSSPASRFFAPSATDTLIEGRTNPQSRDVFLMQLTI
jgi:hypothetical protein